MIVYIQKNSRFVHFWGSFPTKTNSNVFWKNKHCVTFKFAARIFKSYLIRYAVRKSNGDSESVLGLGQFRNFPIFRDVKSCRTTNRLFENKFGYILSIQNNSMVSQFWISKHLKYAKYLFSGLILYIKMKHASKISTGNTIYHI